MWKSRRPQGTNERVLKWGPDFLPRATSKRRARFPAFEDWQSFSINQYFVGGANTLEFLVHNDGGPTALRVEMTGNVTLPDGGSTVALMGLGLAGVAMLRRKLQA